MYLKLFLLTECESRKFRMSNMHSLPTLMDKKSLVDILNQDDDEEMMMKKDHELMELDLGFNSENNYKIS